MIKHTEPDQTLIRMPSLTAVRSFVAAARYESFTRAAESLCVTQAAISRQVRELESYLDTKLFTREGRSIQLTPSGTTFFDAVQLSFLNIAQASDRLRAHDRQNIKSTLTLCCSPAFASLWLADRLPEFFQTHPDIDIDLITTENFLSMEQGRQPDVFITKLPKVKEGYRSQKLFHDVIFPVCTPQYFETHPEIDTLTGLRDTVHLNLTPYGRSQVAEHVDWSVWMSMHRIDMKDRLFAETHTFNANDYKVLIQMVLNHQGVALGWEHLVRPLLDSGELIRPVDEEVVLEGANHYLTWREELQDDAATALFRDWLSELCERR